MGSGFSSRFVFAKGLLEDMRMKDYWNLGSMGERMKAVVRVQASGPSCLEDQDDLVTHTVMRKTEIKT